MDKEVLDMTFKFIIALAVIVGPIVQIWIAKVKEAQVDKKLDLAAKVAKDTHTLVNSNMGVQLQLSAVSLRELADLKKTPKAEAQAKLAEMAFVEHQQKQAVVDAGKNT